MLTNSIQSIIPESTADNSAINPQGESGKRDPVSLVTERSTERSRRSPVEVVFVADADNSLTKAIGQLQNGLTTHF